MTGTNNDNDDLFNNDDEEDVTMTDPNKKRIVINCITGELHELDQSETIEYVEPLTPFPHDEGDEPITVSDVHTHDPFEHIQHTHDPKKKPRKKIIKKKKKIKKKLTSEERKAKRLAERGVELDISPEEAWDSVGDKDRFEVTKWKTIALWRYDFVTDTCAICKNHIQDLCIVCQGDRTSLNSSGCHVAWGRCGHAFHYHCIKLWLKRRPECPICNVDFEYDKVCKKQLDKYEKDAKAKLRKHLF